MKTKILYLGVLALLAVGCFGVDDENYPTLTPISITAASDTINADLGVELVYSGVKVESDLECTYEWAYGAPASGTTVADRKFASIETISTSPTIDYTFTKIGTYILRLKIDNGEAIEYSYFTLNVNSGYDEGICILNNDDEGNGSLTFIKTLTSEDIANGVQEVYEDVFGSINPAYKLKNATALYMSDYTIKSVDYSGLLIATNDGEGTIYDVEAQTFEMFSVESMAEYGTYGVEFGGEIASTSAFGSFFRSADGRIFRFDMQLGYLAEMDDIDPSIDRCYGALSATSSSAASSITNIMFNADTVCARVTASAGPRYLSFDGYNVVNVAATRYGTVSKALYILLQDKADPTSYKTMTTAVSNSACRSSAAGRSFTIDDLKMDINSKMVNVKASNDVYYTYDNAIYRWSLTTAPGTSPAVNVPSGEQIVDIASNFMGKAKGSDGESLLYIATYNPSRSGKKGSLYVVDLSVDEIVKSYEGICDTPVSVIYKYRVN